jgi:hypothetical protein
MHSEVEHMAWFTATALLYTSSSTRDKVTSWLLLLLLVCSRMLGA